MSNKIKIFGAGISGLLSALAAERLGYKVEIYDMKIPTEDQIKNMAGVHYLHDSCDIPGLKSGIMHNFVRSNGAELGEQVKNYNDKIWGDSDLKPVSCSLIDLPNQTKIYDMRQAYLFLLYKFQDRIQKAAITSLEDIFSVGGYQDTAISTIPLHIIAGAVHCKDVTVYAKKGRIDPKLSALVRNYTLYNATPDEEWYRASRAFGHEYIEYSAAAKDKIEGLVPIKKIITTEESVIYSYWEDFSILCVGRYGEWNRKRLAHECYYKVFETLKER